MTKNYKYSSVLFSVDCIVFGFDQKELKVLLIERGEEPYEGHLALPGDLVRVEEDIDDAAARILHELTGLKGIVLEQLHTFGEVDRHPWGRVITVAYHPLLKLKDFTIKPASFARKAEWYPVDDVPPLAFDHSRIVEHARESLKIRATKQPIGMDLLPRKFSLSELQDLYEVVLNAPLDKRNFRRKMLSLDLLKPASEKQRSVPHKPAQLYTFDKKRYNALKVRGFHLEISGRK